jgi:glutaminyl-tRNA synthetase
VFNKIVALKESSAKKKKAHKKRPKPQTKKVQIEGEVAPMSQEEQALFDKYNRLRLNSEVANTLARDRQLSNFYQEALEIVNSPIAIANMVTNEVARELKQKEIDELKFNPKDIAELVKMVEDETISSKIAKQVFEEISKSGGNPEQIVKSKGLIQISDPAVILPIIDEVIAKNSDNVEKFRAGNKRLLGFFVGQVIKATRGKGNPKVVNELVALELQLQ